MSAWLSLGLLVASVVALAAGGIVAYVAGDWPERASLKPGRRR